MIGRSLTSAGRKWHLNSLRLALLCFVGVTRLTSLLWVCREGLDPTAAAAEAVPPEQTAPLVARAKQRRRQQPESEPVPEPEPELEPVHRAPTVFICPFLQGQEAVAELKRSAASLPLAIWRWVDSQRRCRAG